MTDLPPGQNPPYPLYSRLSVHQTQTVGRAEVEGWMWELNRETQSAGENVGGNRKENKKWRKEGMKEEGNEIAEGHYKKEGKTRKRV